MSKSVTYVGPYADINVPVVQGDLGSAVYVERGGTTDLPDDIADELVGLGEWVYASAASDSGAPAQRASRDDWHAYRLAQGYTPEALDGLTKQELIELPDTAPEA